MSFRVNQVAASHLFKTETFNGIDTSGEGILTRDELIAAANNTSLPARVQMAARVFYNEDVFDQVRRASPDGATPVESMEPGVWGEGEDQGLSRNDLRMVTQGLVRLKWNDADPAGAALAAQTAGMYKSYLNTDGADGLTRQELDSALSNRALAHLAPTIEALKAVFTTIDEVEDGVLMDNELRRAARPAY